MIKCILSNSRYKYDKVWFQRPLILLTIKQMKYKKSSITKSINDKSTLLYDLLIKRDIENGDEILRYIIHHLIDVKNGNIEYVSDQERYYVHKMFVDLHSMIMKQFRENATNHAFWGNLKYLLKQLKQNNPTNDGNDGEWNTKLDIDYGLYQAFMSCNISMVKFLINSDIIDIERCLKMGYIDKMFKLLMTSSKNKRGRSNELSERNRLRLEVMEMIINALLEKCNNSGNNKDVLSYYDQLTSVSLTISNR